MRTTFIPLLREDLQPRTTWLERADWHNEWLEVALGPFKMSRHAQ